MDEKKCRVYGYEVVSNFEGYVREFIAELIVRLYGNQWIENLPSGIVSSIKEKIPNLIDPLDFLEETDFPHLKEIILSKAHFKYINEFFTPMTKEEFSEKMDEIYHLRNNIAHVRRHFTEFHLVNLVNILFSISKGPKSIQFKEFLETFQKTGVLQSSGIPADFFAEDNIRCPDNLPSPDYEYDGGFIGRKNELRAIKSMLYGNLDRVITIVGAGGVGKTALAAEVAYSVLDDPKNPFNGIAWISAKEEKLTPVGIELVDIKPIKTYEQFLQKLFEVIAVDFPPSLKESLQSLKKYSSELLPRNRFLIIVDNLETIHDNRIIKFIKDVPHPNKVLITSRRGLGEVERRFELKELPKNDAIQLLRTVARGKGLESLSKISNEILKKYVLQAQAYPLAIKWCIGKIALGKEISRAFEEVTNSKGDLIQFCFNDIFSMLSPEARKILFAISLFEESEFSQVVLSHITDLDLEEFEKHVSTLILSSLIIQEQNERGNQLVTHYSLLTLTRNFILGKLDENPTLKNRLLKQREEIETVVADAKKTASEHDHSLHVMGANTDEEKIAVVRCQTAYNLALSGRYDESLQVIEEAKQICPHFTPIYKIHATIEADQGHVDKASALMDEATKKDPNNGELWFVWGNINRKNRRFDKAYDCYKHALDLSPNDPMYLSTYALSLRDHHRYAEADEYFKKAIESKTPSFRHKIINKSGKAENSRRWAQVLLRDHDYLGAQIKLMNAKQEIADALAIDPLDYQLNLLHLQVLLDLTNLRSIREGINATRNDYEQCLTIALNSKNILRYRDKEFAGKTYYYYAKFTGLINVEEAKGILQKGINLMPKKSKFYPKLVKLGDKLDRPAKERTSKLQSKSGTITFFHKIGKYGFIKGEDGEDYFFHISNFSEFLSEKIMNEIINRKVRFEELVKNTDGKPNKNAITISFEDQTV